MARPFSVYRGGLSAMGQISRPTPISASDIDDELRARGYTIDDAAPIPGIPEPGLDLPPLLPVSPYAKYIRFLPYVVLLFQERSVLDLGKIV